MFPVKRFDEQSQKLTPPLCKLTELTHLRPNWSKPVITLFLERRGGEPRGANKGPDDGTSICHCIQEDVNVTQGEVRCATCHLAGREDNYLPLPCLLAAESGHLLLNWEARPLLHKPVLGEGKARGVLYVLAGLILAWVWLTTEMLRYAHFYVQILEYFYLFEMCTCPHPI